MTLPAPQVVVIGAGIVGASVAWHLAQRGQRVLVIDGRAGAAQGVTSKAFGWVGLGSQGPGDDPGLFAFRLRAQAEWDRLRAALGDAVPTSGRGAIVWGGSEAETQALIDWHRARGAVMQAVAPGELAELEPALLSPPPLAALAPGDWATEPAPVARALLDAASGLGTRVLYGRKVDRIEPGAVTLDGGQRIAAPQIVLANGTGAPALAAQLGVSLGVAVSPVVLLVGSAPHGLIRHILMGPDFEARQRPDGRLFAACDMPGDGTAGLDALLDTQRGLLRRAFRNGVAVHFDRARIGPRPVTADGWPMLGRLPGHPGIHAAVAHPGVILAPFIGRVTAENLLQGQSDPDAGRFAPR